MTSFKKRGLMAQTLFLNAWKEAFGNDFKHLLCSWHVIRNWNSYICIKIKKF